MLLDKRLESIGESDLNLLIENKVSEGKFIEYKKELQLETIGSKKEFLYDVSSFANTSTGHLIIGVEEEKGIPIALNGLDIVDIDAEKNRLDQLIQSGIHPRMVPSYQIHHITLQTSKRIVILIRIHKSLTLPHLVSYDKSNKFYARNSSGKYLLEVGEIRNLFLLSESAIERIRNFRAERLAKILGQETPIPLKNTPKCIMHLVPLSISDPTAVYDISYFKKGYLQTIVPLTDPIKRYNFDGLLAYDRMDNEPEVFAYTQLFRNGCIEGVDLWLLRIKEGFGKAIPHVKFERDLVTALKDYLFVLERIGVEPPILVMLSMIGIKGYNMLVTSPEVEIPSRDGVDRDNLILPEVIVDTFEVDHPNVMKPIFDSIWNACGWERSVNYDDDGKWKLDS